MRSLYDELRKLENNGPYPMHMPGHKRKRNAGEMSAYFDIDITEIDGFDNLHDAEGIIREAEERANALYGAGETHFLQSRKHKLSVSVQLQRPRVRRPRRRALQG